MKSKSGVVSRARVDLIRRGPSRVGAGSFIDPTVTLGHPGKADREALHSGNWSTLSPVKIGRGCTIRAGSVIYAGVSIGDSSQTGNGAVIREGTAIGSGCLVGTGTIIEDGCTIGDRVRIQSAVYIPTGTVVEDDVFIGPRACLTNDKWMGRSGGALEPITIRKHSRIGANSTILPGVEIGEDSIVGAGAVVTRNVARGTVVIGSPAHVLRRLKDGERAKRPRRKR